MLEIIVEAKMSKEAIDAMKIIREALQRYGGRQKIAGDYIMIQCPFHSDGSPSLGVYMRRDNPNIPLGWCNCFSCGKIGWNKLAEKIGAPKLATWHLKEQSTEYEVAQEVEDKLLKTDVFTIRQVLKLLGAPEAQPWPETIPWRGFTGDIIKAVGGLIAQDFRNDDIAAVFPIKIGKKVYGAVKALNEKKEGQLSYITMRGAWVSSYGLFPYDYTQTMIRERNYNFVILVEGPRDALMLLSMGIPALAVLGAQNFSRKKKLYIKALGVDYVYVMPDNDKGGSEMWAKIKEMLHYDKSVMLRRFKLPREKDEEGHLIKIDPFSMPSSVKRRLKEFLTANNGWKHERRKERG